jgi:dTDP-4-amino-4,6-dideoxygalactose transaminase
VVRLEKRVGIEKKERDMAKKTERLALLGGKPLGGVEIMQWPVFTPRTIKRAATMLEKGITTGLGRKNAYIRSAEDAVSRYHGGLRCLVTSSGHSALQMALAGLEIGQGDEVITTPYTWGASVSCILHQGAVPIFADVDRVTGLIDPETIPALVTRRTRAILPVHIFGQPADMTRIMAVARKHKLAVVEDGSQAHAATWKGIRVGNFGDSSGFSCMGGKLLATTDAAGYMVTKHDDAYWRACLLCQHMGRAGDEGFPEKYRPYVDSLVYTYRLNPLTAMLLEEQLKKLDAEINARRANVAYLRKCMKDMRSVSFPDYGTDSKPAYHMVTTNFDENEAGVSRDTFKAALKAEGLGAFAYVPSPIHTWKRLHWQGYRGPRTPWTENLRRAGVDYRKVDMPNCRHKIAHAIDMGFNYYKPARKTMERIAEIFYKVERGIDGLRKWEKGK